MFERQPVPFEHLPAELLEVVSLLDVDRRRFGQANLRNASGCEFWDRRRDAHVSGQGWAGRNRSGVPTAISIIAYPTNGGREQ